MGRLVLSNAIQATFNAIFRPAKFVGETHSEFDGSVWNQLQQVKNLTVVFLANLGLYAGPLTIAGYGSQSVSTVPAWLVSVSPIDITTGVWKFVATFTLNCAYILAATVITLITFHLSIILTRQSQGFLSSAYSVVYSTSAYLAGIFTVVWYLSLTEGVSAAKLVVLNIQRTFVYAIIDFLGSDVGLPSGRPSGIPIADVSSEGRIMLTILVLLTMYYIYSMYLGSRINHNSNRLYSLLTVAAVSASPIIYVSLSITAATGGIPN